MFFVHFSSRAAQKTQSRETSPKYFQPLLGTHSLIAVCRSLLLLVTDLKFCFDLSIYHKVKLFDPGIKVKKLKMSYSKPTQNGNIFPRGVNWLKRCFFLFIFQIKSNLLQHFWHDFSL